MADMQGKKGALERLAKKLDSRGREDTSIRRSSFMRRASSQAEPWKNGGQAPAKRTPAAPPKKRRHLSLLEAAFIASAVFFIGAGVFAGFLFFSGTNTVSTRNVAITIDGPTSIRAGETLPLQIVVTNQNSVPMELTDLVVEFPPGTRSDTDVTVELPRIRETLGTITPGESVSRTVRAAVFGQADTSLEIKVGVEYRVPSSNAIFLSEERYTLPVSQSPASITVESLEEIVSGQETALTVTVSSNITDTLQDLLLAVQYPPGFSFKSASPAPVSGDDVWRLGDIETGGKRTITIRGAFSGEDGDERVMHFTAGTENTAAKDEIAAPLATADKTVRVTKPFISTLLSLDGSVVTEKNASRGAPIRGDIRWINNLPTRVQDVEIEVKFSGAILDRSSVVAQKGFWRSSDNTLVFSRESDSALADVQPGGIGTYAFTFASLSPTQGTFKNPEIHLTATVRARRVAENNVPEILESSTAARVLIATDFVLVSALAHAGGPRPPKADTDTIYTVTWAVTNTSNAIADASVTAALPSYVKFVQGSTPDAIAYNPIGGIVTWTIGDLEAGASKTAQFQVTVTPSLSQVGTSPTVISDQRLYGFDRFTRQQLERPAPPLTTLSGATAIEGDVVP